MKILLLCLYLSILPLEGIAAEIIVSLKSTAFVVGKHYSLSDLADIGGGRSANTLRRLVIGTSPDPGKGIDVPLEHVRTSLNKLLPEISPLIQWRGADSVRLFSKGQNIDGGLAERLSSRALDEWLKGRYPNYRYTLIKSAEDIIVPYGDVAFKAHVRERLKARRRMVVWLDIYVDERLHQTYRFWYEVSAKQDILVSDREVSANTALSREHVKIATIDVAPLNAKPVGLEQINQLNTLQTKRDIEANTAITYRMLEKVPFVTKGKLTRVLIKQDNVGISTKAIALRNGNINERILMQNPETNGRYIATVVGKNQVMVK